MIATNRREFLRQAAAAGATAVAGSAQLHAQSAAPQGRVRAWRTSRSEKFQPIEAPQWAAWQGASSTGIHLDPATRYQDVLGFGGAFTDASCYLFQQMSAENRRSLLSELFGPEGLGFSAGRTCVGSSDYSTKMYSFDESAEPDPELKKFSIAHDLKWIIPTLREARHVNPDLYLFSAPWSPPGWMKAGGSMLGGSMRKHWFAPHAQYFIKFLQAYSAAGVNIQAVTVNNEVDTDQDGRMPAALWGQEYEIGFVKDHLGPALEKASLDTKIWILDHNYNLWGRVVDELSDPGVYKYAEGVAWHPYVGTPDAMTRVHNTFPAKHAYWTEGGPDITSPDYATDWVNWSHTFSGILRNWARCIVCWNLLLNEKGQPNIGPFSCGGLVTVNSKTGQLTRSGQYQAFAHYSKVIKRGAHILASWGEIPGVDHVAAENVDGSRVLVVTNSNNGREQRAQCTLASLALNLVLPPDSITSYVWQA
ncbi:MAG: twin-arginine translocation signal domain-containing protein [Acidobacteriota bacterium]|nr:twin-arginine translocation signal domain-containing protein [Acidobacteriota bacterium]